MPREKPQSSLPPATRRRAQLKSLPKVPPNPPPAMTMAPDSRLYLELTTDLSVDPTAVIDTSEGIRLRISYASGSGKLRYYAKEGDAPLTGVLLSGSDWALVRTDGVALFDSRVTLSFDTEDGPYLLDSTLSGMVDIGEHAPKGLSDSEIFDMFVRGADPSVTEWYVAFAVRFEGSSGPMPGDDTSWLPKHLASSIKQFPLFRPLLRQQFSAIGAISVRPGPYYPPTKLDLTVVGKK